ncbi:MAG: hypothetical protein MK193_10990 [Lentisphaeria bacterium]|nr:hypothetical protein [Lentisphaeria bacterium]
MIDLQPIYDVFSVYKRPRKIDGCACCLDLKVPKNLTTKDLRNLDTDDLGRYSSSVFLEVDGTDFRYFLPRIFDLLIQDYFFTDAEIVLQKLSLADWRTWPKQEQQVIDTFCLNYFDVILEKLEEEDPWIDPDTWLCAVARAQIDLKPYLTLLENDLEAMCDFHQENHESLAHGKLASAFWDDAPDAMQEVMSWIQQKKIQQQIMDTYVKRYES